MVNPLLARFKVCIDVLVNYVHLSLWCHSRGKLFSVLQSLGFYVLKCGATYGRHSCLWAELVLNSYVVTKCHFLKYSSNIMADPAINCCGKMLLVRLQCSSATERQTCWLLSCRLRFDLIVGDCEVYDTPSAMSLAYIYVSEARIESAWLAPTKTRWNWSGQWQKGWNTELAKTNYHSSPHSVGYLLLLTMKFGTFFDPLKCRSGDENMIVASCTHFMLSPYFLHRVAKGYF